MELDYLITNALVIDGSGKLGQKALVGIKNNKIALYKTEPISNDEVQNLKKTSVSVIDAKDCILCPGFIDAHGHTDLFAFADPVCSAKLEQGITTEIAGQCGMSPAPVSPEFAQINMMYYKSQGAPIYNGFDKFTSVAAFMDTLESVHTGINLALFAAHGSIRMAAMGLSPQKPDKKQLDTMRSYATEAVSSGALGVSSGLMYAPGCFCNEDELAEICKGLKDYDGIYTSHIRNQGNRLIESVKETISIAKRAGIRGNVSHHKAAGKSNWGKVKDSLALIHEAGNMTHDVYPYTASSTTLQATLPPSCLKEGVSAILSHLEDKVYTKELEQKILMPSEDWDNDILESGYDGIMIISANASPSAIGKTITEYAQSLGISPFDAYIKLLIDNKMTVGDVAFSMSQSDVDTIIKDDLCMFGTDSLYVSGMKMTHPRSIGTFPRILSYAVKDKKLLALEEAIYKMTYFPAKHYGLKNKGIIAENADADIVIFNLDTIKDNASFTFPIQKNDGIQYVFVGGKIAVENGKANGTRNGHIVKHNK